MKNSWHILLMSLSGVIGWWLNYFYHPLLLRFLSIEDFWTFQSLFWIFNIFSIIIISLSIYLVKEIVKDTKQKTLLDNQNLLKKDILKLSSLMLIIFFISALFINKFLNINNIWYFILLSLSIFFINLELYIFPFLQGLKKFESISVLRVIAPLLRIITWVLLVSLWFWIYGAIWGFVISQALFICIGYKYMRKYIPYNKTKSLKWETFLFRNIHNLKYFFIASVILTVFQNIDILIVKNMFGWGTAGYYAAVSVLAKFLVFLWLSIETVYYPQLVKLTTFPTKKILQISIYYTTMLIGALWFFHIFWETILRLFKDWLQEYIWVIFPLLVYCWVLWYISIIVKTLIAFEKYVINYILSVVVVAMIVCVYVFATDIYTLAYIFMYGSIVGLFSTLSTLFFSTKTSE